jgi:hypothetical protein
MKSLIPFSIVLLFAVVSVSCKNHQSAEEKIPSADSLLAGIERGACFGRCPEYKAFVYTSGYAEFLGIRNLGRLGKYYVRLTPDQLNDVKALLKEYQMAEADSEYVNKRLADFPAYFLTIRDNKGSRKILVNHEAPPENIVGFTKSIDRWFEKLPWIQVQKGAED